MADDKKNVSSDPNVPTGPAVDGTTPQLEGASADVAAATKADGTVDAQEAAIAGAKKREAANVSRKGGDGATGPVPNGDIVRQLENGVVTDRRTGAKADKSIAGENLPVLRDGEPDPRQGVTTGDLTNPGIPDEDDAVEVTFNRSYHVYNRGETAVFSQAEADRLAAIGVID